jgi:hypothetical protein
MFRGKVFLSYSHWDATWMEKLKTHLEVLEKQGTLEVWADKHIATGERWREQILRAIDTSQVAVLLVSARFLSSDFILQVEVPRILERCRQGRLQVVPLLVHESVWEEVPWLAELQVCPRNAVPLDTFRPHQLEAELAGTVREILSRLRSIPPAKAGLIHSEPTT